MAEEHRTSDPTGGVRLGLRGVHHVALNVADLAEAERFYQEVMGFARLATRPDFGFPGAWYQAGAHQIHLIEIPGFVPDRRQHVALEVVDLDATAAALAAVGVAVDVRPYVAGAGRQAFVRDPTGNRIELNEPDRPAGGPP
jgi:glyoxylase I family protein